MEKNTVSEECHQPGNNLVSMSSIKIDSISIDLINASEKIDAENCDHFSIRGYVSGIRKTDWRKCWPFASDGDNNKYDEGACRLPSLYVPKFRYWRCHKCMKESCAKGVQTDGGPTLKSYITGLKPNRICSHAPIVDDVATLASDFQQAPRLGILEDKKVGGDASANLGKTTGDSNLSYFGQNGKKSEVAHGHDGVHNMDTSDQEVHRSTTSISIQKKKTYLAGDNENLKSKSNGFKPGHGYVFVSAELARNLNSMDKSSAMIHEIGKSIPVADQPEELIACGMPKEAGKIEGACSDGKGGGNPSQELDDCNYRSSESAEIMVENNVSDHDNSSGLHRRKMRKVRLLTELLCKNGGDSKNVGDTDKNRNGDSLSNFIQDASTESEKLPAPQDQVAVQGNLKRGLGQHRKRKSDQDEDWRPIQTVSQGKVGKEARVLKRDVEYTDAIAKAFARMQLQTGRKNHCIKRKVDRSMSVGKKKKKKTVIFHESSSLVRAQEKVTNEFENETGDTSNRNTIDGLFCKPMHNSVTGGEADIIHLPAQRKPSFKKKAKISQDNDQHASLIPQNHGILSEDSMGKKAVVFLPPKPVRVPLHTASNGANENGLNLSLNSYLTGQRYDMECNPLLEDGQTCFLTWKEGTAEKDQVNRKAAEIKHLGNFKFYSKSAPDISFGKGVYSDLSGKKSVIRMASLNEKQNYTSQVEIGGCSRMQQKILCSTSGKKKAIEIQEHSAVTRKDSDPRADKVSEQVTSDGIPMEIVELMAKHQYERCLPDAEYDKFQLEVINNTNSSQTMDFKKAYGSGERSFFQQEASCGQNSHANNGRNGLIKRGENVGPAKQKLVDYFSQSDLNLYNMCERKHNPSTAKFGAIFQHQQKPSIGIQHHASSSGRQKSPENSKWIGDLAGKSFPHSCLQMSGTCNTCQGIPQQSKETNHHWSSMMTSRMPFVYSIPEKCSAPPASINMFSNFPSTMSKENLNNHRDLKFLNQNAASLGKQNRSFGSDTLRTCAEPFACKHNGIGLPQKPVGSLDLYSNETIPAMHLLSLMDAGLQTSAPVNLGATPKFLKRPSTTHDQDPKEFPGMDSGAYKFSNNMNHTPSDSHGKNQVVVDPHGRISTIPAVVGPSASSFPHGKCFSKSTDFTCQVSQVNVKEKSSDSRRQISGYRSQKPASQSGNFGTSCGSIPVHNMQTMFFGASDSMLLPSQFRMLENSNKYKLEVPTSSTRPVHPFKASSDGICTVNRNPADFSIPEPGNLFMISGEDLQFGKARGHGSAKLVRQKRQKKLPVMKEHRRHISS